MMSRLLLSLIFVLPALAFSTPSAPDAAMAATTTASMTHAMACCDSMNSRSSASPRCDLMSDQAASDQACSCCCDMGATPAAPWSPAPARPGSFFTNPPSLNHDWTDPWSNSDDARRIALFAQRHDRAAPAACRALLGVWRT